MSNSTRMNYTAFVPNGDSSKETAILLVGTADEYGIDQRSIRKARGGFDITDELADVLYSESESEAGDPDPQASPDKAQAGDVVTGADVEADLAETPKTNDKAPAKSKGKTTNTSGNRAAKNTDSDKE